MKKILFLLTILFCANQMLLISIPFAFAEDIKNDVTRNADVYLNPFVNADGKPSEGGKIDLVASLPQAPQGSWTEILTGVIKLILGITGSLTLASFTWAGIQLVINQANEEKVTEAKKIMVWTIIALIIIATSYAIVLGVSQLQFFRK